MADAKFTPGPYYICIRHDGLYNVRGNNHELIAEAVTEANARLIAAAPNMLAALEEILVEAADLHSPDIETIAKAVIAKAKP